MAAGLGRVPSPGELDAFCLQLGRAISTLDEFEPLRQSIGDQLEQEIRGLDPPRLTPLETQRLICLALEAREAGRWLVEMAEDILDVVPSLMGREEVNGFYTKLFEEASE
jgi:hypothetical protein